MISPQRILDLNSELIVDNFAGGGGASTGIELALHRHVDLAANHAFDALGMHRINHDQTVHLCEDIWDLDPLTMTHGRPVGLVWSSPDCKHFSKAKGGKPLSKKIRGLVLVMLKWAKYGARVQMMENVEEITTWGPLIELERNGERGWYPDPAHKGRTWQAFLACLSTGIAPDHPDLPEILEVLGGYVTKAELVRGFGYRYEYREIRACVYGAPTIRKRLYMVARKDGCPIVWPAETHADPATITKGSKLKPYRTIAQCIDWARPCPSIFLSGDAARAAKCKRPLADATLRRIAKGIERYVLKASRPFLVSLTHQGGDRVEDIDQPSNTITGAHRGEKALVAPTVVNSANSKTTGRGPNTWPMTEPARTLTSAPSFSAVEAELAPFLTEHANASNQRSFPADEPMRTACAQVKGGHFAMVAGTLVHTAHGEVDKSGKKRGRGARDVNECMPTVLASPDGAVVTGTLVQTGYGEREGQEPRALDPDKPLGTVVAGGGKHALAAASMVKLRGSNVGDAMATPMHTASAGGQHHGVVAVSLAREFGASIGQGVDEPAPTVMPHGQGKSSLIAASLTKFNTGATGSAMDEPAPTVLAGSHSPGTHGGAASTLGMVAASCAAYYGSEQDGQAMDEPLRTATTKARMALVESSITAHLTPEQLAGAYRVAAFLRDFGVEFEGEFATVAGHVIVDIGMRMLTPRELFRAQGFPDSYVIDKAWIVDPHTCELTEVALTKEQQIRMCGNSVCPPVAEALVRANVPELIVTRDAPVKRRRAKLEYTPAMKGLHV